MMNRFLKPKPHHVPPIGIRISQMAAKTDLNGQEYFPYQEDATNGRISVDALNEYIATPINEDIANVRQEVADEVQEINNTIDALNTELNEKLDQYKEETDNTISEVKQELTDKIEQTSQDLSDAIEELREDMEEADAALNQTIETNVSQINQTIQDNVTTINNTISETKSELENSISDLTESVSDLRSDMEEADQELNDRIDEVAAYTVNGYAISTNPTLTKSDVGLSNVDNVQQIPMSEKGAASGVATLGSDGYVPSSQLNLKTVNGESVYGSGDITIDMDLYIVASTLPTSNIDENKIYVVPGTETESGNIYIEYIYVNGAWEKVGEFKPDVDLSNYVTFDDAATTSKAGVMSASDKSKLDGITASADSVSFTQTKTSGTALGTITINGTGTTIYGSEVTVTQTQTSGTEVGKITVDGTTTTLYSTNEYELPTATSSTLGGVKLGSDTTQTVSANSVTSTASRTYAVQLNSSDQMVVNVPWSNTTYSAATSSAAGLMSASDKAKLDAIDAGANDYELPIASDSALGGIETGYDNSDDEFDFPVQVDAEGKAYVEHPQEPGFYHIPEGGQTNQILMWDNDGQAAWHSSADLEIVPEQLYAYGVQFDTTDADPELTRVGNMSYHQSLPIHSNMRGCIAQGGKVQYYLDSSDFRYRANPLTQTCTVSIATDGDTRVITSSYFADDRFKDAWIKINDNKFQLTNLDHDAQTAEILSSSNSNYDTITAGSHTVEFGSVRNGYDGVVKIYVPQFYIKGSTEGTTCTVYISSTQIDTDYVEQPAILIDAYKATILNTVPENMGYLSTLSVNSAVSICNSETYCRGGSSTSTTYDEYLESDPTRTWLNKGRTNLTLANERTYARNAGAELLSYEQYKNAIYWLYVIEYANFNSQADYNANLTDSGYRQGGLGAGMTSINYSYWSIYNGNNQITPNGYLDEYGTSSAILPLRFEGFDYSFTPATTWSSQSWNTNTTTVSGVSYSITSSNNDNVKTVTSVPYSGCNIYAYAHTVSGSMSYTIAGLSSGQQIRFATSGQTTLTVTTDGTYTMDWGLTYSNQRFIYFDFVDTSCSITITINSTEAVSLEYAAQTITVNRWRGMDCPFGDTWLDVDGILIDANTSGVNPTAYITTNSDNYTSDLDTLKNNYTRSLTLPLSAGYITSMHIGNEADIMPATASGGSTSTYMCDYYNIAYGSTRRLRIGGGANHGSLAGLGYLYCSDSVSSANARAGFRTVNEYES